VRNELWRRARAVPSLDLRFAENKSLRDSASGSELVTFTRASSGTFVGSDGVLQTATNDTPRFDHNPTTGESLGLLVEEQRVNLLLRSAELDNVTSWTFAGGTLTANNFASPDSTQSADTVTLPAGGAVVSLFQVVSCTASTTYTFSFYARLGTLLANDFTFAVRDDTNAAFIAVDIVPGVTLSSTQWNRVTYTFTTPVGCVLVRPYLIRRGSTPGGTVHFWGAQLEAGAFPTSYIPTTTATVTRSADVCSDTTRGGNIRSLFTQFRSPASGTRPVVSLDDNTANERIEILTNGTDPKLLVTDGGSAVADIDAGTVSANTTARIAARFQTDDYGVSIDGATSQLDAAGTLPTATRVRIGSNQAGGYLNGTIARITGWESALPLLPPVSG
jgi:hypothetical protein